MNQGGIPVFFIASKDLIEVMCVAVSSLLANSSKLVDLYFMDCDLLETHRKALRRMCRSYAACGNMEFLRIDVEKEFFGMDRYNGFLDTWARISIPRLAPDVNRGIYLDNDVVVLGDISELWAENLNGHAIGCAIEIGVKASEYPLYMKMLKLSKNDKYTIFNNGVILMDFDKYREQGIEEKLKKTARDSAGKLWLADLAAMNMVFGDRYKILEQRYNISCRKNYAREIPQAAWLAERISEEYISAELNQAVIVHFSPQKPWRSLAGESGGSMRYFNEFWAFAKNTPYFESLQWRFIHG
ncbi:MAG: glycosyltransferase family 8 protein [Zoogloeaceae bacterium]|jgi:lipopolysaccharide biosynthesis glycosyltransferase|nr:glycosyltransferase family 8 protein [Zoogloeaceae bacterium]